MTELEKRIRIRNRIARKYGNRAAWHYETIYMRTEDIKFLSLVEPLRKE